jgi:hypothetical protein
MHLLVEVVGVRKTMHGMNSMKFRTRGFEMNTG